MKILLATIFIAALTGCGAEIATTAASGAATKKQEMESAQQTREMTQKKIDQATQAIQQNAEQAGNVNK